MEILTDIISFETKADFDVVDITDRADRIVTASHCDVGFVNLFAVGATTALTTIEFEGGLVSDLADLFETLVPKDKIYKHNEKWQDGNGHSHVRAALLGPSLVIPLLSGRMVIGQWQHVVCINFDIKPRRREVICQVVGTTASK